MNSYKRENLNKARLFFICFVFGFLAVFNLIDAKKDLYTVSLSPGSEYDFCKLSNSRIDESKGADLYTITPFLQLKPGEYEIKLQYDTEEKIPVNVCYISEYDVNTQKYPVHNIGYLIPGENNTVLSLDVSEYVKQAVVAIDYQGKGLTEMYRCDIAGLEPMFSNRIVATFVVSLAVSSAAVLYYTAFKSAAKKEKIITLTFLIAFVVISSIGLLKHDIILSDDYEFHLLRILGIAENIQNSAPFCKVNFAFNGGYGYLNPAFYPQLYLWAPAFLVVLGANVTTAYLLFIFLINIFSVIISYKCFKSICNSSYYAVMITGFYILNYYRLKDIYMRAAVGELLFLMMLPVVFYGIYLIFNGKSDKWYVLMFGCCAVFQAHILGTVLTAIAGGCVITFYIFAQLVKKEKITTQLSALVKAGAGTIALNLWFLVPMIYYMLQDFGMFSHENYLKIFTNNSYTFKDILFNSAARTYCGAGFVSGLLFVALLIVFLTYLAKNKKISQWMMYFIRSALFLFLSTKYMFWQEISSIGIVSAVISKLQFAFRFVTLFIICLSMSLAVYTSTLKSNKVYNMMSFAFSILLIISTVIFYNVDAGKIYGADGEFSLFSASPPEYLMQSASYHSEIAREDKFRVSSDNVKIEKYDRIGGGLSIEIENASKGSEYIDLPLLYYAGYEAEELNSNTKLQVTTGENFVVRVLLEEEISGTIQVKYQYKWYFYAALAISAISFVLVFVYLLLKKYNKLPIYNTIKR